MRTQIASSDRNLPDEMQSQLAADAERTEAFNFISAMVDSGMEPALVTDAVHDSVVANRFWILTHDETKDLIARRADQIVQGINPGTTLPQ